MNKTILRFSAVYIALVNAAWGQSVDGQPTQGIQLKLDSNLTLQQAGRFNDIPAGAINSQNSPLADTPPMNISRDAGAEMVRMIELAVERDGIPADGQSSVVLTVRLFDKDNKPVTLPTRVTLETSLGRFKRLDRTEGLDFDKIEPGNQIMVQNGVGQITLLAPHEPGDATIRATAGRTFVEGRLSFIPDLRPMIAVGLIEGIINFRSFDPSKLTSPRSRDTFDQEMHNYQHQFNEGKGDAGIRAAFFLKGAVKGEYLLTMAYESDKETRDRFFRDIHPDEFYPVYGDSSIKGYDAQTTSRFYFRVDNKKSYFMFGDLVTASTHEGRTLGNYSRTLTGVKEHYENKNVSVNVFGAKDNLRQVVDEFPARGVSGWYNLSKQFQGLTNSEKVEIVTRDRNQRAIILKTELLTRLTDYQLEEFSGRILLSRPVPSFDANLNPNFIRVSYEIDQGGERFWVGGADAQVKLGERLEVGASFVEDRNPTTPYKLKSANSTAKLGEKTFVSAELAQSNGQSGSGANVIDPVIDPIAAADKTGKAARIELRHNGEDLQARLYASKSGSGFDNPSSGILPARTEAGAIATYKIDDKTRIIVNATRSEDRLTEGRLDSVQASVERSITDNLKFEFGLHRAKSNGIDQTPTLPATTTTSPTGIGLTGGSNILPRSSTEVLTDGTDLTSVRAKLTAQSTGGKASAYIEGEQDTSVHEKRLVALGGDYRFSDRGRLYGRIEDIKNETASQRAAVIGVDTSYMKDGQIFNEYRLRDSIDKRSSENAIGVRNLWTISEGLRFSTGFEYLRAIEGDGTTGTAASLGVDYTANPLWKGSARLEARRDNSPTDSTINLLSTLGLARKLDRDWTFLGKNIYSLTNRSTAEDQVNERFQMGFAYRDTDTNRINWLSRYQYSYFKNDPALGASTDPSLPSLQQPLKLVHELSTHVDYHPSRPHLLNGGYAARLVKDTFAKADGTRQQSNYLEHWLHGRYMYDFTERFDIGLIGSLKYNPNADGLQTRTREYSAGIEFGYLMRQNLWASLGYNFIGFKDSLTGLADDNYTSKGPFLRLRYKFDHHTFSGNDPTVNKTLIPDATKPDEKK
ncbi:MAG: Ig-like domain-containing protein [Burkholderiales bacterium]